MQAFHGLYAGVGVLVDRYGLFSSEAAIDFLIYQVSIQQP